MAYFTRGNTAHITFMPSDLVHLHDAVFPEGEVVESLEIRQPPVRERHWWDADAIHEEFGHAPKPQDSPEYRVDWYLGQLEKNNGV